MYKEMDNACTQLETRFPRDMTAVHVLCSVQAARMCSHLPGQPVKLLAPNGQKVLRLLLQPLGQRTQAGHPRDLSAIHSNTGTPITEPPAVACTALASSIAADSQLSELHSSQNIMTTPHKWIAALWKRKARLLQTAHDTTEHGHPQKRSPQHGRKSGRPFPCCGSGRLNRQQWPTF